MKRWVYVSVCVAIFLSVVQAKQPPIMTATPVVVYMPALLDNPDFFSLSDQQRKAVMQVAQASSASREALDQTILDLRKELRDEQEKFVPDAKLVAYLLKEIAQQEAKRLQQSIDCANGLKGILTSQQWNTLIELANQ